MLTCTMKALSNREVKLRIKPWVNSEVLNKNKERNKAYQKYLKRKDIFWCNKCIYFRDETKILINRNQKSHLRDYFQASTQNFKTAWSKINEILNKKRNLEDIYLGEYEIIVTDPKLVVNQLEQKIL